ncbi:YitT family protein [[Clostridium] hylemonae]
MKMKKINWKETGIDILVDIAAGMVIAIGVYNFALNANFPVAGFSGIAIVMYHLLGLPVGAGTIILNIPVAIFCYKFLGRNFFLKSLKSMIISSFLMDYVAPYLPVYEGSRLLAALCMGVLCGIGYAMIFMRGSSTGGQDFISVAIKKVRPHMTLGIITFVLDILTIILGSVLVFKDVDGLIYGIIVTYLMAIVMDRIMYGIDEGKMTFIVTEHGEDVAEQIDEYSGRGSTILKGMGSYSKKKKDVVMCACNNKQMYTIKKMVHNIDPQAFTIIMESNEVVGEGFKEEIKEL